MEYLTTNELAARIKFKPGTIRNLVWQGELKEGIHFVRPTPRKLLFLWSEIEKWLHRPAKGYRQPSNMKPKSLINI